MTQKSTRKWYWSSKGTMKPKSSNRNVGVDDTAEPPSKKQKTDTASHSYSSEDGVGTQFASRVRQGGSKFLSIVGLQKNIGAQMDRGDEKHTNERDTAIAIARDAAESFSPISATVDATEHASTPSSTLPAANYPTYKAPVQSLAVQTAHGLRETSSNPSFAHQLSHKLSQTFGNPTIVHRPNLRTRPSLLSVHTSAEVLKGQREVPIDPEDSTSPSSYNRSGSTSVTDPSTAKTSLESGFGSPQSANGFEGINLVDSLKTSNIEPPTREGALTPIQEIPQVANPSLLTVESAANAKIFFETHFNALLAGHATPRSLRKRHLELRLEHEAMSEDHRDNERLSWANLESDHLRNIRVLKSSRKKLVRGSKVTFAGYRVVRVLGKGSFGVVRLVRERDVDVGTAIDKGARCGASSLKHPVDALKPTLELPRLTQRPQSPRIQKDVYAMKVIRKSDMLRNCQEAHLRAERDFLVASEHSRWVVPLIASFQDHTNLYLVMDYMIGGDFLGLLFRKNILKEKHARWYIAEMILCVEETHRNRWIHRDIKPDNFLISASGHLKISDFGLAFDGHWAHDQKYFKSHRASLMEILGITAKGDLEDQEEDSKKKTRINIANVLTGKKDSVKAEQFDGPSDNETILQWRNRNGKRKMAASIVGTSQYMAPEVIRGDAYDGRCDWWSIGIILYECLYGFTPFVCENRDDTKAKILNNANSLIFPSEKEVDRKEKISYEALELMNSLLQEKEYRLSSKKYRWNDWQHSTRSPGQLLARRSDPLAQDYRGNFVYPDDASDIKAHPFFSRIVWDRLHLSRPPFVPDVKSRDDTKYFDEEEPVSDVDDASTQSGDEASEHLSADEHETECAVKRAEGGSASIVVGVFPDGQVHHPTLNDEKTAIPSPPPPPPTITPQAAVKSRKDKNKKRPRDRVLRDKELSKIALDLRKRGAFLGYTYRRPKFLRFDEDGVKQQDFRRRSLLPSFE